jgi:hypothetical protein
MQLRVRPSAATAGRRTTFRFRVTTSRGRPVRRATVRFARKRARTGRRGRARIVATLPRPGSRMARAVKRGRSATARVTAKRAEPRGAPGGQTARAESFAGNCEFSGYVAFTPPLTNTAQPVSQQVRAPGKCSGTFTDARGRSRELTDAPVTYLASARGASASCMKGEARGSGTLVFPTGRIGFTMSEVRTGSLATASARGTGGGSAAGAGSVSPSEDPASVLQRCAGPGLDRVALDIRLTTTDRISG